MEAGGSFSAVQHGFEQLIVLVDLELEALSDFCACQRGGHHEGQCGTFLAFAEQLLRPAGTARHLDDPLSPSGEHPCTEHGAQGGETGWGEGHACSYAKGVGWFQWGG